MNRVNTETILREAPHASLSENINALRAVFRMPENKDVSIRVFKTASFDACVAFLDGLSDSDAISSDIIRACVTLNASSSPAACDRLAFLEREVLFACQLKDAETFSEIVRQMLDGLCALFADGCPGALILDTRSLPHRAVGHTNNESVVLGSQEGFVENLRVNISLIRKHLRSAALVTEMIPVGSRNRLNAALLYVDGVTDETAIEEARKRLKRIELNNVSGTGQIQQLIEDHPFSLFPQLLQTERPDRAASGLAEGQLAILAENSPYALMAPSTLYHFIHASDDTFMRWQYGTFLRVIRVLGMLLSLLLPGVYLALTQYHSHLLPMSLLTSIAEARSNLPFPIVGEILIMEFSFFLINEAGTRIPSQIGSALGIVGALILGQAAVSASIISPILIIIVALTGLGNFVVPSYSFSLAIEINRLGLMIAGTFFGLYGVVLGLLLLLSSLCAMRSFGVPFLAPCAPWRPHSPDILLRPPLWRIRGRAFFSAYRSKDA